MEINTFFDIGVNARLVFEFNVKTNGFTFVFCFGLTRALVSGLHYAWTTFGDDGKAVVGEFFAEVESLQVPRMGLADAG